MRRCLVTAALAIAIHAVVTQAHSQDWSIGGNMGLSVLGGSSGFHITPMAEFRLDSDMAVGSEFSINTQYYMPLLWYPYFKYYFNIPGSTIRPYATGGPVMTLNVPSAPNFGFLFGGGVNIPIAKRLYLAPDVTFGQIFGYGGGTYPFILRGYYWGYETYGLTTYGIPGATIFAFCIRGGIRYEL